MVQRYKLRLGDGTVLLVDHDGLSTWLVDGKAQVQFIGSSQWRPLKEFLARERRSARRAERERASTREALPLVYPEPQQKEEGAPEGIQAPADDPILPETASAPGPSTADEAASAGLPEVVVDEEGPVVSTDPPPTYPEPSRPGEPAGVPAPADDPVSPAAAFVPVPPTPDDVAPVSLPQTPVEDERTSIPIGSPRVAPEPPLGEPAGVQALAEDPVAPAAPFVPVPPKPDAAAPVSLPPPLVEDSDAHVPVAPPSEPAPIGTPAGVQILADEPVVPETGSAAPPAAPVTPESRFVSPDDFWPAPAERTGRGATPDDGPAVIPLRPLNARDAPIEARRHHSMTA